MSTVKDAVPMEGTHHDYRPRCVEELNQLLVREVLGAFADRGSGFGSHQFRVGLAG
jgi:hypothetical protein